MRTRSRARRPGAAGATMLEIVISTSIFAVIGAALAGAIVMGQHSQETVVNGVSSNEQLRESNTSLVTELKVAGEATIVVETLADGNHQLSFMQPIEVGSNLGWGVFNERWGDTPELRNREDWKIRYTVAAVPDGIDGINRRLIRQVLDDSGEVQETEVIAESLRSGDVDPPGFSVVRAGDMWEISITTVGRTENSQGQGTVFHVKTRN